MKHTKLNFVLTTLLSNFFSLPLIAISCNNKIQKQLQSIENKIGVWAWRSEKITDTSIKFLKNHNISEIYLKVNELNSKSKELIAKLKNANIDIFFLMGNKTWLLDDTNLIKKINQYKSEFNTNSEFKGIHLDIEPHQYSKEFKDLIKRKDLISRFLTLIKKLKTNYPDITFDYDIPFWLKDEIEFDGKTQEAYKHIMNMANSVYVMAYRSSAEKSYSISKHLLEYAAKHNKEINICIETDNNENLDMTYYDEGKGVLANELTKLSNLVPKNVGFAIHHLDSFEKLKS
ncbi:hypothetical protein NPL7_00530 [Metamycoplasma hyosynoviae]|uniref:hypothetical protein n=1 Tax=Metamycoplasma hyosynoviae TaxID=29559 RepID=UPI000461297E|nr:hypothetical protein [Metamycoplasma hyosynoviae]KDE42200.1 hypothetical protein NPL3_02175 [Metamycoplasma hyosynoviae]KDE42343.1 hypothetical protein NPL7_00530 [Metamycoplasma hyosynoviae]KDE43986.1 hypothetical protein NPL6_02935 [Metamycoplasma hyosynoviae]KDE44058.1 hypothetical protein NPL5_00660 [Metamycoplasma hyosynoviae]